jgi:hypothetical protein
MLAALSMSDWSDEETDNPLYADERNFYKVERWSKDDQRIEAMLYAGNNLDKARDLRRGREAPSIICFYTLPRLPLGDRCA